MVRTIWVLVFLLIAPSATAQRGIVIEGTVKGEDGEAFQYVNVQIENTIEGAATDNEGVFRFSTAREGEVILVASMIGFESVRRSLFIGDEDIKNISIVLKPTLISLEEATVTASAFKTGEQEGATLGTLEVVTTPGAAADVFLAIKSLPGIAMVDEGAGLFVRGGDVDETVVLLDQATVAHPYKYETPTGGVFGTIPPFLVSGTFFSSGGFSAKYGNALSGVLAMESQPLPLVTSFDVNFGLAAASLGGSVTVIPGKLGLRFSGNLSFTKTMMELNGFADDFVTTPHGRDINVSLIYAYSETGGLKYFTYANSNEVGVLVEEPSFVDTFQDDATNRLHNLQWSDVFGEWFIQSSFSVNYYNTRQQFGNLRIEPGDETFKFRTDAEHTLSDDVNVRVGGEFEQVANTFKGSVPDQDGIFAPEADVITFDERYTGSRAGGYGEVEWKVARRVALTAGIRADQYTLGNSLSVEPRLSLLYALGPSTDARLAWGQYRQVPSVYLFSSDSGNPNLELARAQHFIAGLHHEKELLTLRLEGYYKPYGRLAVEDDAANYLSEGKGFSYGVDAFAKYGAFLLTRFNGWISYSYLQSERTQTRYLGYSSIRESGPSPFDITHNLSVVAKVRLINFLSTGLTYRFATGRPITPITGSVPGNEDATYFLPIEGPVGTERLSNFQRLDAQISYYLPFGKGHNANFYIAFGNVLNRANVLGYEYNLDYSERRERRSNYRRFLYFGVNARLVRS